jgi:hypothetical protein
MDFFCLLVRRLAIRFSPFAKELHIFLNNHALQEIIYLGIWQKS